MTFLVEERLPFNSHGLVDIAFLKDLTVHIPSDTLAAKPVTPAWNLLDRLGETTPLALLKVLTGEEHLEDLPETVLI